MGFRVIPEISIIRPLNLIMAGMAILIGVILTRGSVTISELRTYIALLPCLLIMSGFFILNDVRDLEIDKIVHPERDLPSLRTTVNRARGFCKFYLLIAFISGFITIFLFDTFYPFIIILFNFLMGISYEYLFKRNGLSGNLIVSIMTGSTFLYGGSLHGNKPLILMIFIMILFSNLAREITKDIQDKKGDQGYRNSAPFVLGMKKSTCLIFYSIFIAIITSILLPIVHSVNFLYYPLIFTAVILLLISLPLISRNPIRSQMMMKLGMLVAIPGLFFIR